MKIRVSVLVSVPAVLLCVASAASSAPTLLEALGKPRIVEDGQCREIAALERGKFQMCRTRWLGVQLDEVEKELEKLRSERIERQRNAVWDWLKATPVDDCDTVPEIEIAKFPFCAATGDEQGLSLLARHEDGLSQLRTLRGQLSNQLEDLRVRLDALKEREEAQLGRFGEPPSEELERLLARLRDLDSQTRLMEAMSIAEFALDDPVVALRMIQAPTATDLRDEATVSASVIASVRTGERVVLIETDNTQSEFIPVVHGLSGFGYVSREDFEQ